MKYQTRTRFPSGLRVIRELMQSRLPFREDFSAGLGILTKTYLDELGGVPRPIEAAQRQAVMDRAEGWLIHTDVAGSFKLTCELWDALLAGVQAASAKCVSAADKKQWAAVDAWFKSCRP